MADEPTMEEAIRRLKPVAAAHDSLPTLSGREQRALRTLLASHASLEKRVEEAKRLILPFRTTAMLMAGRDDEEWIADITAMPLKVKDVRALAAFVNEKET